MSSVLLSPKTDLQLKMLIKNQPHAILLTGEDGVGKFTVAKMVAQQLSKNCSIVVEPDSNTIGIDTVRQLYQTTRAKQQNNQVVIIDHAETMSIEAQNAFLKLLEEPGSGVIFILTAPSKHSLLATVISRLQSVNIHRLDDASMQKLLAEKRPAISAQEMSQMLFIANGRPAILSKMLNDSAYFAQLQEVMMLAKKLISATVYDRLCLVNSAVKTREDAICMLEAMLRILQIHLLKTPSQKHIVLANKIQGCLANLVRNGNPRAQLTALFTE